MAKPKTQNQPSEFPSLSQDIDINIVIPSKGRHAILREKSLKLFPDAYVTVEEADAPDYLNVVDESKLLLHPPLNGLPAIRNWIVKNVPNQVVFMVDDDIDFVMSYNTARFRKHDEPEFALGIIVNAAILREWLELQIVWFCPTRTTYGI